MSEEDRSHEWAVLRRDVRAIIKSEGLSIREAAREIELSNVGLTALLENEDRVPQRKTLEKVREWVSYKRDSRKFMTAMSAVREVWRGEDYQSAHTTEEELFLFFRENPSRIRTLIEGGTEGLSGRDRKIVAFSLLNSLKRLALDLSESVPAFLFEIEQQLLKE